MQAVVTKDGQIYGPPDFAEALDELSVSSRGLGGKISSEADWKLIQRIVDFWIKYYEADYRRFFTAVTNRRGKLLNQYGLMMDPEDRSASSDTKTSLKRNPGHFRHLLNLPYFVHNLLRKWYPDQDLAETKFVKGMSERFPIFTTGAKI